MLHAAPVPKMMPLQSDLAKCAEEEVRLEMQSSGCSSDDENENDSSISSSNEATRHPLPLQCDLAKKAGGCMNDNESHSCSESTNDNDDFVPEKRMRQVAEKEEKAKEDIVDTLEICASSGAWATELVKAFWSQTIDLQNTKMALEQKVSDIMIASQIEKQTLGAQLAEKAAVEMKHEFVERIRQIRADSDRETADLTMQLQTARIASQIEKDSLVAQLKTSSSKLNDACMKNVQADNAAVWMKQELVERIRQMRTDHDRETKDLTQSVSMRKVQADNAAVWIKQKFVEQIRLIRADHDREIAQLKVHADNAALSMKHEFVEKHRQVRVDCDRETADLMKQLQSATAEVEQLKQALADAAFEKNEMEENHLQVEKQFREGTALLEEEKEKQEALTEAFENKSDRLGKELAALQKEKDEVAKELLKAKSAAFASKASQNSGMVGGVKFQYELSPGQWESMSPDKSDDVLKKYIDFTKNGRDGTMMYEAAGNTYEVSFATMTQKNTVTRKERKVRYKFDIPADWSTSDLKLMQLKCQQQAIAYKDCVVEITDASRLVFFTQLLKHSIHHHGPSVAASACDDLAASLQVKQAWRVENITLRLAYENCKRDMVEQLRGTKPQEIDPPLVAALATFGKECHVDPDINEAMLFHGTKSASLEKIITAGFDDRVAKAGFYGMGTYFASQVCKSKQYVDSEALILVSRVLLGDPHFATAVHTRMRRPPERNLRVCDSVIARPGSIAGHSSGYQTHQEFVIFERAQAYPEYILKI